MNNASSDAETTIRGILDSGATRDPQWSDRLDLAHGMLRSYRISEDSDLWAKLDAAFEELYWR